MSKSLKPSHGIAPFAHRAGLSYVEAMAVLDPSRASWEDLIRAMQKLVKLHEQILEKDNDA